MMDLPSTTPPPAAASPSGFSALRKAGLAILKDWFNDLTTKDYERENTGKTQKELEASRRVRARGFFTFCSLGLGAMYWGGASTVLDHMKENHKEMTAYCAIYLAFAHLCQLVGLTAAIFPNTSPWPMFFAGLGAWQSGILALAIFHIGTMNYHQQLKHAEYSMIVTSVLLSLYWSYGPQDPMLLHFIVKLLVSTPFYILRELWRRGRNFFSSWFKREKQQ